MARVSEVKHALKQGDKARAAQLLKETLQKNPSAEAWYLAAQMSNDPDKQKRHLQRALAMDSKHTKSRDMLRELGGKVSDSAGANILAPLFHVFEDFGGEMEPQRKRIMLLGASVFVAFLFVILVTVLFSGGEDRPEMLPAQALPANLETQVFVDHFTSGGLTIPQFVQVTLTDEERVVQAEMDNGLGDTVTRTFHITDKYAFTVMDAAGANEVEVIFYQSFLEASLHQQILRNQNPGFVVEQTNNSILIYPETMDSGVAETLIQVYKNAPQPADVSPA